jgi:hypothetical protein
MLFCARLSTFINLLRKHRHLYPPRYVKLLVQLCLCVFLQGSIRREDKFYKEHVRSRELKEEPVFITGHWRSGTTYLHYLMALDRDNFAYPTSYQCLFPTIFLTVDEHSWRYKLLNRVMGTRTRHIDNMEFTLTSPQEEEWMYLPEGGFSYIFESLRFPQTSVSNPDEIIRLSNDELTKEITLRIFRKLTFAHNKRILSKSPGHFSRIHLLKEIFPGSKFIFLVRNPYDVVISMVHMKSILSKRLSFQKYCPNDIASAAKFLSFYYDTVKNSLVTLQSHDFIFVKYESLINHPVKYVQEIYDTFNFQYTNKYEKSLLAYLETVKDYKRNQFEIASDVKDTIYRECPQVFHEFGYGR